MGRKISLFKNLDSDMITLQFFDDFSLTDLLALKEVDRRFYTLCCRVIFKRSDKEAKKSQLYLLKAWCLNYDPIPAMLLADAKWWILQLKKTALDKNNSPYHIYLIYHLICVLSGINDNEINKALIKNTSLSDPWIEIAGLSLTDIKTDALQTLLFEKITQFPERNGPIPAFVKPFLCDTTKQKVLSHFIQDETTKYFTLIARMYLSFDSANQEAILDKLHQYSQDPYWLNRYYAAEPLIIIASQLKTEKNEAIVKHLIQMLDDKDAEVKRKICVSLSTHQLSLSSENAKNLTTRLTKLIRYNSHWVGGEHRRALVNVAQSLPESELNELVIVIKDILGSHSSLLAKLPLLPKTAFDDNIDYLISKIGFSGLGEDDTHKNAIEALSLNKKRYNEEKLEEIITKMVESLHSIDWINLDTARVIAQMAPSLPLQPLILIVQQLLNKLQGNTKIVQESVCLILTKTVKKSPDPVLIELIQTLIKYIINNEFEEPTYAYKVLTKASMHLSLEASVSIKSELSQSLGKNDATDIGIYTVLSHSQQFSVKNCQKLISFYKVKYFTNSFEEQPFAITETFRLLLKMPEKELASQFSNFLASMTSIDVSYIPDKLLLNLPPNLLNSCVDKLYPLLNNKDQKLRIEAANTIIKLMVQIANHDIVTNDNPSSIEEFLVCSLNKSLLAIKDSNSENDSVGRSLHI